jgi:hypothetical protein
MKSVFRTSEEALATDFIYDAVRMTMEAKSDQADSFLVRTSADCVGGGTNQGPHILASEHSTGRQNGWEPRPRVE